MRRDSSEFSALLANSGMTAVKGSNDEKSN